MWRVGLDPSPARRRRLALTLSREERERAARLRLDRDRRRFVVARGGLRMILGEYLGVDPGEVEIGRSERGKPRLTRDGTGLRFSLSRSGELALCAVAWDREVGVDVERLRPIADALEIAEHFFSERERQALRRRDDERRQRAFFRVWTRKEAWLKACGVGLTLPLDRVEVSVEEDEPARLLSVPDDSSPASCWSLHELAPSAGYLAALAVAER